MGAHDEHVDRVLASCTECGAAYAAWQWPDGDIRPIGTDTCTCGSDTFDPVDEHSDSNRFEDSCE